MYAGMAPRDRVLILLQMLGGAREIELPKSDVLKIGTMACDRECYLQRHFSKTAK